MDKLGGDGPLCSTGADRELVAVIDDCRVQSVSALYLLDECRLALNSAVIDRSVRFVS